MKFFIGFAEMMVNRSTENAKYKTLFLFE